MQFLNQALADYVKSQFEANDWQFHIVPVVKYAKELAHLLAADEKLTEAAALLHDIGRVKIENDPEHHIFGIKEAEKIMLQFGYAIEAIEEVKHCIHAHRSSDDIKPQTLVAEIVANADAMSHFDAWPLFFYWRADREKFIETVAWVEQKIERNWNKKLTLTEAKKMVESKYLLVKAAIANIKQYY